MLQASREAVSLADTVERVDLEADEQLGLALARTIQSIGEAVAGVSLEFRRAHPSIPWIDIIATIGRLTPGAFQVDPARVWDTVTDELPSLIEELEKIGSERNHQPE